MDLTESPVLKSPSPDNAEHEQLLWSVTEVSLDAHVSILKHYNYVLTTTKRSPVDSPIHLIGCPLMAGSY